VLNLGGGGALVVSFSKHEEECVYCNTHMLSALSIVILYGKILQLEHGLVAISLGL